MPQRLTKLVRVQMVKEATVRYEQVSGCDDAYRIALAIIGGADREHFIAIHLDTKHRPVSVDIVAIGTVNACLISPREVFKAAILANATAIVICHNHPSGDHTPSPEDIALTETLVKSGELLGIKVLDHLVIGDGYTSLRQQACHVFRSQHA